MELQQTTDSASKRQQPTETFDLSNLSEYEVLEKLRERFFWVKSMGGQHYFVDMDTGTEELSQSHIFGAMIACGIPQTEAEKIKGSLHFLLRPIAKQPRYAPKQPKVLAKKGIYFRNLWKPPTIAPDPTASAKPFTDHLLEALGDQSKVDFFLDLMAYRYQFPEKPKPHSVCYFYHAQGGNGKSLLGATLQEVFGESAVRIASEAKMNSGSKVQLWTTTLLVAEEANVTRGSDIYDTIKTYSGSDRIYDDIKHNHFSEYEIPASLIMLSNRPPSFLEPHDSRFFVSEWVIKMEEEDKKEYFKSYVAWLESGGYAAIAGLLASRDVSARDMYAPVPLTDEKLMAMSVGQDDCVRDIRDFLEDNPTALAFTEEDFKEIFEKHGVVRGAKHKLVEAGLVRHDKRLKVGKSYRYPLIRQGHKVGSIKGHGTVVVTPEGKEEDIKMALYDDNYEL